MAFINTCDTMPGATEAERAQQVLDGLVSRTLTEFKDDKINYVGHGGFQYNTGLQVVELPNLVVQGNTSGYGATFLGCTALKDVKLESLEVLGVNSFGQCDVLESVRLPDSLRRIGNQAFYAAGLTIFNIKGTDSTPIYIDSSAFQRAKIKHLIIRSKVPASLADILAFSITPISANEGGIYVPADLVDTYKNATNWSFYANIIYPIVMENNEIVLRTNFDSIQDTWTEILASEEDGTYKTKYHIGDTKTLNIGDKTVKVQIAAFDTDTITGGNTKAKITWICKNAYDMISHINEHNTSSEWPETTLYARLNDDTNSVYNNIDPVVKTAIKTVVKTYWGRGEEKISNDKLWLLSSQEVNFSTDGNNPIEENGVVYSDLFLSNNNYSDLGRMKQSSSTYDSIIWWLRSDRHKEYNSTIFAAVNGNGGYSLQPYNQNLYTVFGFCT